MRPGRLLSKPLKPSFDLVVPEATALVAAPIRRSSAGLHLKLWNICRCKEGCRASLVLHKERRLSSTNSTYVCGYRGSQQPCVLSHQLSQTGYGQRNDRIILSQYLLLLHWAIIVCDGSYLFHTWFGAWKEQQVTCTKIHHRGKLKVMNEASDNTQKER